MKQLLSFKKVEVILLIIERKPLTFQKSDYKKHSLCPSTPSNIILPSN